MTILAPPPPGAAPLLPLAPIIPGVRGQSPRPDGRKASEAPVKQPDSKRPIHLSGRRTHTLRVTRPNRGPPTAANPEGAGPRQSAK